MHTTSANDPLAQAIYGTPKKPQTQLCVLLCAPCNYRIGTGQGARDELLAWKMEHTDDAGRKRIVEALRTVAGCLKEPGNFLPHTLDWQGQSWEIWEA